MKPVCDLLGLWIAADPGLKDALDIAGHLDGLVDPVTGDLKAFKFYQVLDAITGPKR